MRHNSTLTAVAFLSVLSATAASTTGCGGEEAWPTDDAFRTPSEEELAEESLYMHRLFESQMTDETPEFIRIDLADDRQYKFLIHRLLLSGNTPDNAPRLFDGVRRQREIARRGTEEVNTSQVGSAAQALVTTPCGHLLETPQATTPTQSTLSGASRATCFKGVDYPYGYTDITIYETDAAQSYLIGKAYTYSETYAGVTNFITPTVSATSAVNTGKYHFADAITYIEHASGSAYTTYSSFKNKITSIAPAITVNHPNNFNGGLEIRNCLKRAEWVGAGDCDYAAVDDNGKPSQNGVGVAKMSYINSQWVADTSPSNKWTPWVPFAQHTKLNIPLRGAFDAGAEPADCIITGYLAASATIVMKNGGGWCNDNGNNINTEIFDHLNVPANMGARYANFHLLGDFGADCLPLVTNVTEPVQLTFKFSVSTTCGERAAFRKVTRDLDFKDSCFAKGTSILRGDGKYAAVEALQIGERVMIDKKGTTLSVVSISRGGESKPLVRLIDSFGHNLLLTEKHPVVTTAGIVKADQIREGDTIETESGPAMVATVERVPYDGEVYNLTLGTTEELSAILPEERTMFAGGILVGDNGMQQEMQMSVPMRRGTVDPAWQADYQADLRRSANLFLGE